MRISLEDYTVHGTNRDYFEHWIKPRQKIAKNLRSLTVLILVLIQDLLCKLISSEYLRVDSEYQVSTYGYPYSLFNFCLRPPVEMEGLFPLRVWDKWLNGSSVSDPDIGSLEWSRIQNGKKWTTRKKERFSNFEQVYFSCEPILWSVGGFSE